MSIIYFGASGSGATGPAGATGPSGPTGPTGGSGGAPADATYITQTSNSTLSAEQALSALSTGVVTVTTGTGVLASVAAPAGTIVGTTDSQLLTNKTATTPAASDNTTKVATTAYVTTAVANAIAGVNPAVAVQAATAAILPNSPTYSNGVSGIGAFITTATLNTALVVDGYTPALLDRILVKNESGGLGAADNGVYYVSQLHGVGVAWILTRALDYDQPSDMNNTGIIPVSNGTVNVGTSWYQTSQVATVGTDAVTFTQFSLNYTKVQSTTLTSAHILVGNGSNLATDVALSGDATIDNTGAITIANSAVTNAKIANSTINLTTKVTGVLPAANGGVADTVPQINTARWRFGARSGAGAPSATLVVAANTLYAVAIEVYTAVIIDTIGFDVSAAATGNARMGIYGVIAGNGATGGNPGNIIVEATTGAQYDTSGATGVRSTTGMAQSLNPGIYYLVACFSGTPTVRANTLSGLPVYGLKATTSFNVNATQYFTATFTYAALPASFGAGGVGALTDVQSGTTAPSWGWHS